MAAWGSDALTGLLLLQSLAMHLMPCHCQGMMKKREGVVLSSFIFAALLMQIPAAGLATAFQRLSAGAGI